MRIHDEDWLKMSALYWDSMRRIKPAHYHLRDSSVGKQFAQAGFLIPGLGHANLEACGGEQWPSAVNHHRQRWTLADTHGRSTAGHAYYCASSPRHNVLRDEEARPKARGEPSTLHL